MIKFEVPDINNNIIMESIDAEFFEEIFPFKERHNEIIKRKINIVCLELNMNKGMMLNLGEVKELELACLLDLILSSS